jgi:hypothetical protein
VSDGDLEQVRIEIVHDPVLRPRKKWREPPSHRAGTATEIVDHPASGSRAQSPHVLD